jgi:hypothetical protein
MAGAAALLSVGASRKKARAAARRKPAALGELEPGTQLGPYRIVRIAPLTAGAVPVVLEGEGGVQFQVDVLRRSSARGNPAGIASTKHFELYLANGGDGVLRTDEVCGLGAMALAAALRGVEAPAGLLSMRERMSRYPDGNCAARA